MARTPKKENVEQTTQSKETEKATKKPEYVEERRNIQNISVKVEGKNFNVKEITKEGKKPVYYISRLVETKEGEKELPLNRGLLKTINGNYFSTSFSLFTTDKSKLEKICDELNNAKEDIFLNVQGYVYVKEIEKTYKGKTEKKDDKEITFEGKTGFTTNFQKTFTGYQINAFIRSSDLEPVKDGSNICKGHLEYFIGKPNPDVKKDEQYNVRTLAVKIDGDTINSEAITKRGAELDLLIQPTTESYKTPQGEAIYKQVGKILAVGKDNFDKAIENTKQNKVEETDVKAETDAQAQAKENVEGEDIDWDNIDK